MAIDMRVEFVSTGLNMAAILIYTKYRHVMVGNVGSEAQMNYTVTPPFNIATGSQGNSLITASTLKGIEYDKVINNVKKGLKTTRICYKIQRYFKGKTINNCLKTPAKRSPFKYVFSV